MTTTSCQLLPSFVERFINLADPQLGAEAVFANDEFFASKERMLDRKQPVFVFGKMDGVRPGLYMDGWETRRRRVEGHDHCIVKLGLPGVIHGVDVDTSHFTGNFPPAASIDACRSDLAIPEADTKWTRILTPQSLNGNAHNFFEIASREGFTHVKLNIHPDGGVARLRIYGQAQIDWSTRDRDVPYELSALSNGGYAIAASDKHYGSPNNLLQPGRGDSPVDGWETRRLRTPGNDWVVIALGHGGRINKIEVDTAHFRGNYPDRCSVQAAYLPTDSDAGLVTQSMFWRTLLPEQKLEMHSQHFYDREILDLGTVTHLRFNIFPDGGVMRLRAFGLIV